MRAGSIVVVLAWLAMAGGCAAAPAPASRAAPAPMQPAKPTGELRLRAGQEAVVQEAAISVRFVGVEADSRCGKGETCVWEGSAGVRLIVTGASGTQAATLHTSPRAGPDAVAYEGWSILLVALEPHPVAGRSIAVTEYIATLRVERGADSGTSTQ
jgi:hypothetical protein